MIRLNPNDLRTVNLGALDDADPWKAAVSRVIFGIIRAVEPPLRPVPIPGLMPPRPTATLSETLAAMIEADDPTPPCPGCAEAEAKVKELEHETADMVMVAHQQGYERAKDELRPLKQRMDAIDAARQGEPPCPGSEWTDRIITDAEWAGQIRAWGRQGWDAAAALRVELAEQTRRAEQAMAREAEAANSRDEWRARYGSSLTEVGILVDLVRRLARQLGIAREWSPDYQIEALDAAWDAAAPYCQEDRPVRDGEDEESREDDVPHDGFHDGHDTPEERDGER